MNAKIVGLDRQPYEPPIMRRDHEYETALFRTFMVRLWRWSLIVLSALAIGSLGIVLGTLIWFGKGGIGEAFAAVLATCFLLGFSYSGFAFFTRRPIEFHHHHHYANDGHQGTYHE